MRIWGIVCQPICSSVGEVVRSRSQGRGPEGQERKVRAASRAEESESTRGENVEKCAGFPGFYGGESLDLVKNSKR